MSRIDVVPSIDGKIQRYRILVNFVQFGVELTNPSHANKTAIEIKRVHYPHATVHPIAISIEVIK